MAYIGNKPEVGNFRKCDAITTSATATYNLLVGGVAVNPNQNQCIVSLNGVIQSSGNSYTIASSQITFASTLASSDVIDFILILGDTLNVGVPSDDTVDASKITANVITGQSALGVSPADTDEFLVSDAGVLKRVDYSYIKGITQASFLPNAQPLWINGDMAISQRSTSVAAAATGYNTVDRYITRNTTGGTWTQSQEALTSGNAFADGFSTAIKMDCTTANASLSAGSQLWVEQKIEGQNLQVLKKGTANAEKITFGFWVKATKTGINILNIYDADNNRQCSISYTIDSTDTWEKKIVNFPADTTGALGNDNGASFRIFFLMAMGSNFTSGTLATTWATFSNADWAVGQVNNADSTSNNFHVTAVQMEVGEYTSSDLPPFRHETYGANLLRCQRYYQLVQNWSGGVVNSSTAYINATFWKTMRTTPSVTTTGALNGNDIANNVNQSSGQVTLHGANENGFWGGIGNWSSLTTNNPFNSRFQNTNKLAFSSEL